MAATTKAVSESEIARRFDEILMTELGVDQAEITPDANISKDLLADEYDIVEVAMAAEEEFKCELDDDAIERADTVAKFRALIDRTINK